MRFWLFPFSLVPRDMYHPGSIDAGCKRRWRLVLPAWPHQSLDAFHEEGGQYKVHAINLPMSSWFFRLLISSFGSQVRKFFLPLMTERYNFHSLFGQMFKMKTKNKQVQGRLGSWTQRKFAEKLNLGGIGSRKQMRMAISWHSTSSRIRTTSIGPSAVFVMPPWIFPMLGSLAS